MPEKKRCIICEYAYLSSGKEPCASCMGNERYPVIKIGFKLKRGD